MQSLLHWTWNRLKSDRVGVSVFHPQMRVFIFFFSGLDLQGEYL